MIRHCLAALCKSLTHMVAHHDNLSDLLKPELSQISIGLLLLHSFNHLRFSGFQFYNMLTQGLFHFEWLLMLFRI